MFLRVDLASAEPLFEQIAFGVKDAVARGELVPGAKLPSVRELAQELSINPNTVVRAYEALERDGDTKLAERVKRISENRRQLSERVSSLAEELFKLDSSRASIQYLVASVKPMPLTPASLHASLKT